MDATSAIPARPPLPALAPLAVDLWRLVTLWLVAMLSLGAVVVCARRAGGALAEPLPSAVLLAWMALVGGCVLAFRAAPAASFAQRGPATAARWGGTTLLMLLWIAGLSLPGTAPPVLIGIWGIVLAVEAISWARRSALLNRGTSYYDRPARFDAALGTSVIRPTSLVVEDIESLEQVSQRLVRKRDDGGEVIEGWLRVELAAQQRHATAHLAICPPLACTPRCYAEPSAGPGADVKVAQVLPYGVRFEIKLDAAASEPTSVVIDFAIREHAED
jgi:hypothetical protein